MPIRRTYTHASGLVVPGAHYRVGGLAIDYTNATYSVVLEIHPDAASAAAGKPPLDRVSYWGGQVEADGQGHPAKVPALGQVLVDQAGLAGLVAYLEQQLLKLPSLAGGTSAP